jgi:hypothetical protein
MGLSPYIASHVALEEHRHNVDRKLPDPDCPPALPVQRLSVLSTARLNLSGLFRTLANRLDPDGAPPEQVTLFVLRYPGDGEAATKPGKESHG